MFLTLITALLAMTGIYSEMQKNKYIIKLTAFLFLMPLPQWIQPNVQKWANKPQEIRA